MAFKDELKSGKFTIYAQWASLLSIFFLVILGLSNFFSFGALSSLLIFIIIAWVEAAVMIFLEVPILTKCCPAGPRFSAFLGFFESTVFRTGLYAAFAVLMWLSLLSGASSLLVCAITLTATAGCYTIAMIKREGMERSSMLGGQGVV
ncbi:uncharacterized protein BJ171DRAFT_533890 [Polychytrium aggregatum]|uniref:uncharacterized protein n=1 Tax=Polychytrium aggregatum TaxID=110093 RepID=UPI0022FEA3C2|nr:uncharacterized protein BJ171DRAFT_533890 [Polychytrium aggregatum]KAI9193067.1 hypothetical protein BJ171DRAFT_533890 [Polychytrium aggregatum]